MPSRWSCPLSLLHVSADAPDEQTFLGLAEGRMAQGHFKCERKTWDSDHDACGSLPFVWSADPRGSVLSFSPCASGLWNHGGCQGIREISCCHLWFRRLWVCEKQNARTPLSGNTCACSAH